MSEYKTGLCTTMSEYKLKAGLHTTMSEYEAGLCTTMSEYKLKAGLCTTMSEYKHHHVRV